MDNKENKLHSDYENKITSEVNSIVDDVKKGLSLQLNCINQKIEKKVTPNVIAKIQEYVQTHNPFDHGSEGIVYRVPIEMNGGTHYFLVAKKRYDHNITKEYNNHKYISQIIDGNFDFKNSVDIPKLYGQFDDATQNESYIIMDYIQGKTLFAKLVENISGTTIENDIHAEKALRNFATEKTGINHLELKDLFEFLKNYINQNQTKIFSYKEGATYKYALKQFLNHIHKNGFYHRDIGDNRRNVIFGDDNKMYIIDFGLSKVTDKLGRLDPDDLRDIYFFAKKGDTDCFFSHDEILLDIIEKITTMPEKQEPRELRY